MKISVILPCFNGAKTIAVQLKALAQQTWLGEWEIIFSNNGSTDNTLEIVESFRDQLPNLTVVNAHDPAGPRFGAWHSYNTGFKAATGDAFVCCEADDEVGDGWLAAMANALEKHEFVAARMDYHKLNTPEMLGEPGTRLQEADLPKLDCPPYYNFAFGCAFGLRRSVYEKLGGFTPQFSYTFDSEYCYRAQQAGIKLHFVPDAVVHYRLRQNPESIFKQQRAWSQEFNQTMRCYGSPKGKLAVPRKVLTISRLLLKGSVVWPLSRLGFPIPYKVLTDLSNDLGWQLGELSALTKPLPKLLKVSNQQTQSPALSAGNTQTA